MHFLPVLGALASIPFLSAAQSIAQINGNRFVSPIEGEAVTDVRGLVTAIGPRGFWLRSTTPDYDARTSESVYVFDRNVIGNVTVGDIITMDGDVFEYRRNDDELYLTEIVNAMNIEVESSGNEVQALLIGAKGRNPPTESFTYLDEGDIFGVPNNISLLTEVNPVLQPKQFGLDFWESLSGELVTVRMPRAISRPNSFGDTWVVGNWRTTGDNNRGGLTVTDMDANPEAIVIGTPLDGSSNPDAIKLGDSLAEITGVVTYAFGFYRILPYTAISVTDSQEPYYPAPPQIVSTGNCEGVSVGAYNVENLFPESEMMDPIASQIVEYLLTPDLIFIQEIQDNTGPTNDGVVDADITLQTLSTAIFEISGGAVNYSFVDVDPVDLQWGGQPGGNIRNAYLYNPEVLRLSNPNQGGSTDSVELLSDGTTLSFNPGLIMATDEAFARSRPPLVAAFETVVSGDILYAINVHYTSKGGSTSLHGNPRPPINNGVDRRLAQAQLTADFIAELLAADPNANVIAAGDFNEFAFVQPMEVFAAESGLTSMDVITNIPETERYTYIFGANSQQLDHMFVSPSLQDNAEFEHVHVSSWVLFEDVVSDHDPALGLVQLCEAAVEEIPAPAPVPGNGTLPGNGTFPGNGTVIVNGTYPRARL